VIEWEEDFLTAGIREVHEETGIDVEIASILTITSNFFKEFSHTIAVVLLAHAVGGELRADATDVDQARWFSIKEPMPEMAFEGDRHIIERYFEAPFAGAPVDPRLAKHHT
jgi:ADP-ribose pyrophosphatase YjhB (NUDIX family)